MPHPLPEAFTSVLQLDRTKSAAGWAYQFWTPDQEIGDHFAQAKSEEILSAAADLNLSRPSRFVPAIDALNKLHKFAKRRGPRDVAGRFGPGPSNDIFLGFGDRENNYARR